MPTLSEIEAAVYAGDSGILRFSDDDIRDSYETVIKDVEVTKNTTLPDVQAEIADLRRSCECVRQWRMLFQIQSEGNDPAGERRIDEGLLRIQELITMEPMQPMRTVNILTSASAMVTASHTFESRAALVVDTTSDGTIKTTKEHSAVGQDLITMVSLLSPSPVLDLASSPPMRDMSSSPVPELSPIRQPAEAPVSAQSSTQTRAEHTGVDAGISGASSDEGETIFQRLQQMEEERALRMQQRMKEERDLPVQQRMEAKLDRLQMVELDLQPEPQMGDEKALLVQEQMEEEQAQGGVLEDQWQRFKEVANRRALQAQQQHKEDERAQQLQRQMEASLAQQLRQQMEYVERMVSQRCGDLQDSMARHLQRTLQAMEQTWTQRYERARRMSAVDDDEHRQGDGDAKQPLAFRVVNGGELENDSGYLAGGQVQDGVLDGPEQGNDAQAGTDQENQSNAMYLVGLQTSESQPSWPPAAQSSLDLAALEHQSAALERRLKDLDRERVELVCSIEKNRRAIKEFEMALHHTAPPLPPKTPIVCQYLAHVLEDATTLPARIMASDLYEGMCAWAKSANVDTRYYSKSAMGLDMRTVDEVIKRRTNAGNQYMLPSAEVLRRALDTRKGLRARPASDNAVSTHRRVDATASLQQPKASLQQSKASLQQPKASLQQPKASLQQPKALLQQPKALVNGPTASVVILEPMGGDDGPIAFVESDTLEGLESYKPTANAADAGTAKTNMRRKRMKMGFSSLMLGRKRRRVSSDTYVTVSCADATPPQDDDTPPSPDALPPHADATPSRVDGTPPRADADVPWTLQELEEQHPDDWWDAYLSVHSINNVAYMRDFRAKREDVFFIKLIHDSLIVFIYISRYQKRVPIRQLINAVTAMTITLTPESSARACKPVGIVTQGQVLTFYTLTDLTKLVERIEVMDRNQRTRVFGHIVY